MVSAAGASGRPRGPSAENPCPTRWSPRWGLNPRPTPYQPRPGFGGLVRIRDESSSSVNGQLILLGREPKNRSETDDERPPSGPDGAAARRQSRGTGLSIPETGKETF